MPINAVLGEGSKVVIAVRDTLISVSNPYPIEGRVNCIKNEYNDNANVEVIRIPDIKQACYDRDVCW